MKKTLFVVLLAVMALVLVNGVSSAAITGTCGTCHTMHNSQDGANVTYDDAGALTSTPRAYLLIGSCVYCHVDGAAKTTAAGGWDVANSAANFPSGFFDGTSANNHSTVETVGAAVSVDDAFYSSSTPGDDGTAPADGSDQLTCAGSTGCHMRTPGTYHHAASSDFRFISGVAGLEADLSAADMESAANHNVYDGSATGLNDFCATCHGTFHGTANTGSGPFVRHPTDNAVTGDWATPVVSYTNNPWGFSSTAGMTTTAAYDTTNAVVMCVSCHRAHGSANSDNLRFVYANQLAGTAGTGCQGCHNK